MAVHTHAHQGARPGPGRKAVKRMDERQRRDQREQLRELQERARRHQAIPRPDDGPPPRID